MSRDALTEWQELQAKADEMKGEAAKDIEREAISIMEQLRHAASTYKKLTGHPLPGLSRFAAQFVERGDAGSGPGAERDASHQATRGGRRSVLRGDYAGLTIPQAICYLLKNEDEAWGVSEIADEIGGNRQSIQVALNKMLNENTVHRPERGKYLLTEDGAQLVASD